MSNKKIFRKKLYGIGIPVLVILLLYLVIFEFPLLFTPLRNKPQEITVFRYGESVTVQPGDEDFQSLYRMLRNAGKGTLSRIFDDTVIMDEYLGFCSFGQPDVRDYFCQNSIVLFVRYDTIQAGRLWLATGAPYNTVVFIMNKEGLSVDELGITWDESAVMYTNTEGRNAYRVFNHYNPSGSMKEVASYVMAMDFSSATTG